MPTNRLFSLIERYDRRLIWLNLLSLFFIVLMPFTTSLVGEHGGSDASVIVYALSVAGAGFANIGMAAYALAGRRLCSHAVDDDLAKFHIWRGLVIALTFLVSLVLLPLGPAAVELSWLSLAVTQRIVSHRFVARSGVRPAAAHGGLRSSPNLAPNPCKDCLSGPRSPVLV